MCDTWRIWEVLISIRRSRSSAILETKGTPRGRFGKHQIPIGCMTTDGTRRSSVDSSGAHDGGNLHQRRTIGRLAFFREETTIDVRSWPDRHTIVADCRVRISICGSSTIKARSPHNQSPIATRSWPDR